MSHQNVLEVRNVWKKYCRQLKRAMWYGVRDVGRQLVGSRNLVKPHEALRPGEFYAVRDACFDLPRGQCLGLIGPNGAGKSTMLKIINGLIRPDFGEVRIRGKVGALIELGTGFNPILSGRENVYINAAVLGLKKKEVDRVFDEIVEFSELSEVINDPIRTYSSGMKVRLGFSVAAHLQPDLLIMDEVLAVGDIGFRMKCFQHLNQLTEKGVSIILVTHAVSMLPRVASRVVVFDRGQIVFDGDLEQGISLYEQKLSAKIEQRAEKVSLKSQVEGAIETVETCDEFGKPKTDFRTGEKLCLRIGIRCTEPIPKARINVSLSSPTTEVITTTATVQQGLRFDLTPGQHHFLLEFDNLPLLVGAYFFNLSLFGEDMGDFHHRRMAVGTFRIVGVDADGGKLGNTVSGIVRIPNRWTKLESEPNEFPAS
jgi:lipopolysaccharide transport system ATP-binding protein